jgi:F0F1-type ATP synthase epsilon subunit
VGGIVLEVVTPRGLAAREAGLERVVVRRREPGFELGGEVAILPRHAPMLLATCAHRLRYHRAGKSEYLDVGAGVAEVLDDTVTLVVPFAERV